MANVRRMAKWKTTPQSTKSENNVWWNVATLSKAGEHIWVTHQGFSTYEEAKKHATKWSFISQTNNWIEVETMDLVSAWVDSISKQFLLEHSQSTTKTVKKGLTQRSQARNKSTSSTSPRS